MKYELSITPGYCSGWTVVQAVRELLQNAIDSEAPFEVEFSNSNSSISIISRGITLPVSTLLLGSTDKFSDKSKIGNFGEGYKIALLILTCKNKEPIVYNGKRTWTTRFTYSEAFQADVLTIDEEIDHDSTNNDLIFKVDNLRTSELIGIKESCLLLQDVNPLFHSPYGYIYDIDTPQASKLYVGGLYICDTKLHYGYDIAPEYIQLERDRKTVENFNLLWIVKNMWELCGDNNLIGKLLEKEVPDVEYLEHTSESIYTAALSYFYTAFSSTAIPVATEHARNKLIEAGVEHSRIKVIAQSWYNALRCSAGFKEIEVNIPKSKSPEDILQDFYSKNKKHMNNYGQLNFRKLIKISKNWKYS